MPYWEGAVGEFSYQQFLRPLIDRFFSMFLCMLLFRIYLQLAAVSLRGFHEDNRFNSTL